VLDGLRGEDSIAELCRPLPGRVMQSMIPRGVRASLKASITNGPSTARQCMFTCMRGDFIEAGKRRLAGDTARAANTDKVKELRREAKDLKEVVAEQTLELRLLKKSMFDGGRDPE